MLSKNTSKITIIPEILSLYIPTNQKTINYFSFGENMDTNIISSSVETPMNIHLNFINNPEDMVQNEYENFSTFYKVNSEKKWLLYTRKYLGIKCQMYIDFSDSKNIKVFANKIYYNLVRFKIDNLYPIGVHLTDIVLSQIIRNGDTVFHAASVANDKGSFLIIAPPDTGKTYTTYKLIEQGYKYLGEDLSYFSKATNSLICMPRTSTWGHRFMLDRFSVANIPIVNLFIDHVKKTVVDIFGKKSVVDISPLKRIYLLQKSSKQNISQIDFSEDTYRKILCIQRNEFSYYKNPLLRVLEYFNLINIEEIMNTESNSLRDALKSHKIFLVESPSHEEFWEIINNHYTNNE